MKRKRVRREAERYLWHLRPEWVARFDHDHWWTDKGNEIPIEAAVWEIIRRHPDAMRVQEKRNLIGMNLLGISIRAHGFRSWPKLTPKQRNDFKKRIWKHLSSQHGYVVPPVTVLNDLRQFKKYLLAHKTGGSMQAGKLVKFGLQEPHLNRQLCEETLLFHRSGQIIVAIDPGAHPLRVAESVKAAVEDWQGSAKHPSGGKARNDQRLSVIEKFEGEELSRKPSKANRNADLFTRYRRIIGSFVVAF